MIEKPLRLNCFLCFFPGILCVWLTILSIFVFMFDFLDFLNEDVHIVKNKQS